MTDATPSDPLAIALRYLALVEAMAPTSELESVLHPDIVHRRYPNRFDPNGLVADRVQMVAAAEKGRALITDQRYAVRNSVVQGATVMLEIDWSGALKIPLGPLAAGHTLRAACAMVLEIRDGKIIAQRNYDCFDP
jgi:ketosteroid isomerase-like protein